MAVANNRINQLAVVSVPSSHSSFMVPENCNICRLLTQDQQASFWDRPVFQTESFIVLPSLGAIIEGWLLIVPKVHVLSCAALDSRYTAELNSLEVIVSEVVTMAYGRSCSFEHGPSSPNKTTGCSVDHAHMHVIPYLEGMLEAANELLGEGAKLISGTKEDCLQAINADLDYLSFRNPEGDLFVASAMNFTSQLFRHVVAIIMDDHDEYDWRKSPKLDNVRRTVEKVTPLFQGRMNREST